jgi:3D (Asp-Asp-Asp) domain-containing protein
MRWLVMLCLAGLISSGLAHPVTENDKKISGSKVAASQKSQSSSAKAPSKPVKTVRTETKEIPFKTEYRFDRNMTAGRHKTMQTGIPTKVIRTIEVTTLDGKVVNSRTLSETKTEGRNEIILIAKPAIPQTRGGFIRTKVIEVEATAYSPHEPGLDFRTASGMKAGDGIIAVDPRIIPLGTKVYVEGYGFAIAADTGGAIKGHRIDVCFNSLAKMDAWGRKRVKVHILE